MENSIKYIEKNRQLFLQVLHDLSLEQLNEIPEGFNNNIIWNFGHSLISSLALCYVRSSVDTSFKVPFFDLFGSGTRPGGFISQETVDQLKELAVSSLQQITAAFESGKFNAITPFSTHTYGFAMSSIEEVLTCCLAHESMHMGVAKAQKAVVRLKIKEL